MPIQARLLSILGALLSGVAGWKPTTNLTNELADLFVLVNTAQQIDPNLLPKTELQHIESTAAGFANLASGQAAVLGTVPASFDGVQDDVVFIGLRQFKNSTAPSGSPAAQIKAILSI